MNHKTSEEKKCNYCTKVDSRIYPEDDEHCECPTQTLSTVLEEQERLFDEKFHDDEVGQESTPAIVMGTDIAFCRDVKDFLAKSNRTVIEKVVEMVDEDIELAKERVALEEKIFEKTIGNPNTFEKGRLSVLSDLQAKLRESIKE